nr:MAG TPA: hypothetical protein [Caudoviricetes sp.]
MRGNKKSPRVNVSLKLGNKKPRPFPIRVVNKSFGEHHLHDDHHILK